MGIFDDSFSMELKHPIDKEMWKIIEDAELDNTEHIYFTTPSGKRVDFIKADVLDKIRAEIKALSPEPTAYDVVDGNPIKDAVWETLYEVLQIIDKYKKEGEE